MLHALQKMKTSHSIFVSFPIKISKHPWIKIYLLEMQNEDMTSSFLRNWTKWSKFMVKTRKKCLRGMNTCFSFELSWFFWAHWQIFVPLLTINSFWSVSHFSRLGSCIFKLWSVSNTIHCVLPIHLHLENILMYCFPFNLFLKFSSILKFTFKTRRNPENRLAWADVNDWKNPNSYDF